MPYNPPSEGKTSERSGGRVRSLGLRPPNRNAVEISPIRTVTKLASTFNGVIESREEERQEFQVRMAAQRLLIAHLRPEADEYGAPTNWKFWPGVELDLTGAVLTNWKMDKCRVAYATFLNARFCGSAVFWDTTFQGTVAFGKSIFKGLALFMDANFENFAAFGDARFEGSARFSRSKFGYHARFDHARFEKDAGFQSVAFEGFASFRMVTFEGPAQFKDATFEGAKEFNCARAKGDINHEWPPGWELLEDADPMKAPGAWGTVVPGEDDLAGDDPAD